MKKAAYLLFIISPVILQSQSVRAPLNIPYLSSAQFGADYINALSFNGNSSLLPPFKGVALGIYGERKYMIEGLNNIAVSFAFFRKKHAAGIMLQYFGNPFYNEIKLNVNYGKNLGKLNIGGGITYSMLTIAGAEKTGNINIQLSCLWSLPENIYAGWQICNPHIGKNKINQTGYLYKTGLGYQASSKVYTGFELNKEENKPPELVALLLYHFEEKFFARMGFISGSSMPFIAGGWKWRNVQLELFIGQQAILGISPAIIYNYLKKEEE